MTNKFKIYYTNCDCFTKSKINDLEVMNKLTKPNIICLTEVLPKNSILTYTEEMYTLHGYTLVKSHLKGRGICLYCNPSLKYNVIDIPEFDEAVGCEFFSKDEEVLLVILCYRSPNSSLNNDGKLLNLLSIMSTRHYNNIVILGDFNYKSINWQLKISNPVTPSTTLFLEKINDLFLEQLVSEPTRFREGQRSNILDLVLCNDIYFIDSIDYCEPLGCSDHISMLIYLNFEQNGSSFNSKRMYYNGDYVSIKKYLGEINWNTELNLLNTQQSWDLFNKTVDFAIDKFIPLCDKPRTGKQWCNANVKARSKEKRNSWSKLWKIIKSNRSHIPVAQIDTSTSVAEWNTSRNISTKCSDDARIAHEKKIIAHCKDNPKTFWSYVKSKTKKPGDVSSLLNPEGQLSHNK